MTVFALQPVHYPQILDGMVEGVRSAVVQVLPFVQLRRPPRHFEAIEEQVNDRLSFSRFAGLGMDICGAGQNARTATSWRLSPTTCTEHRGLLCPIASDKGETGVR